MTHGRKISVTGLGYVGLPVAVAFGRRGRVIGFDIDNARVEELRRGVDRTAEVSGDDLRAADIEYTTDAAALRAADFHIITVPTPVDAAKRPDFGPLERASASAGSVLERGDIVVYESTVYPGATEELCVPILEARSGLRHGRDFFTGYSPERINPGDRAHGLEAISKVVAACDEATLRIVAAVYAAVIPAGIHEAPSIRVAEAAKVIENTQRDLNIALMNELAMLLHRLDIDTEDVLRAAATKWNFAPYQPGLVGGHCIGVDPYYLTHKAMSVGYTPQVILAGRSINDGMGAYIAGRVVAALRSRGGEPSRSLVTLLGFTFKENIPDTRNTGAAGLARAFTDHGVRVQVHDPLADRARTFEQHGVRIVDEPALEQGQAVVVVVPHAVYRERGWQLVRPLLKDGGGIVFDVKGVLDRDACPTSVSLQRL